MKSLLALSQFARGFIFFLHQSRAEGRQVTGGRRNLLEAFVGLELDGRPLARGQCHAVLCCIHRKFLRTLGLQLQCKNQLSIRYPATLVFLHDWLVEKKDEYDKFTLLYYIITE